MSLQAHCFLLREFASPLHYLYKKSPKKSRDLATIVEDLEKFLAFQRVVIFQYNARAQGGFPHK